MGCYDSSMRAMVLTQPRTPLDLQDWPTPRPGRGQVLVKVGACAVCRTDLHVADGDLTRPSLPLVLGHEITGTVIECGPGATRFAAGTRVGVPWLASACGTCDYCARGQENLCGAAKFTGYDVNGGFAEYTVADEAFVFAIPHEYSDTQAAPLLCAGLIGYRSLLMAGPAARLGLYGFGAAAHIVAQVARYQGREVFAFTRPGDEAAQAFARRHGAGWAGGSDQPAPVALDAAIIFAPVGALVPAALAAVRPGGVVVCGGIHMSTIPAFEYALLWGERQVRSVANLTRADGEALFQIAPRVPVTTEIEVFPLQAANEAMSRLREGKLQGAAVLVP
jgi:alcohol dehydrogenase, propanol-preferring